jgi:hypothetical protein
VLKALKEISPEEFLGQVISELSQFENDPEISEAIQRFNLQGNKQRINEILLVRKASLHKKFSLENEGMKSYKLTTKRLAENFS